MKAIIFIEPHERFEASRVAYSNYLTSEQKDEIEDAPDGALIRLDIDYLAQNCTVLVIEEG